MESSFFPENQINRKCHRLSDNRCICGSLDRHSRDRSEAENHHRIQNDIHNAACHHAGHGHLHASDCLKQLLINQGNLIDDGEHDHDPRIAHSIIQYRGIIRKCLQKQPRRQRQNNRKKNCMYQRKQDSQRCCAVRILLSPRSQIKRHCRIDADAKADADRTCNVLQREDQRQSRHCVLADPCNEKAVHNVVQRIHKHRQHHRHRHRDHKRQHRLCFHKALVHHIVLPPVPHKKPHSVRT